MMPITEIQYSETQKISTGKFETKSIFFGAKYNLSEKDNLSMAIGELKQLVQEQIEIEKAKPK